MTTVLIVSQQDFVLDVGPSAQVEVIGRTNDPGLGIELASRLHPEVIVWTEPAEATRIRHLRRSAGDAAIFVLGPRERWWELEGALDAGADGYSTTAAPLDAAIRAVCSQDSVRQR